MPDYFMTSMLNHTAKMARKAGFTLIEMSIVLVIIGLIVGGVLVGQSLIAAATVRSQISQIEKYNIAVNTFREKFGFLPGDMNVQTANQFGFLVGLLCAGQVGGHGFRATASTILNENGFDASVIERQLAHAERDEVRAAYNHAQYLPERRKMMQWWADYLDDIARKK